MGTSLKDLAERRRENSPEKASPSAFSSLPASLSIYHHLSTVIGMHIQIKRLFCRLNSVLTIQFIFQFWHTNSNFGLQTQSVTDFSPVFIFKKNGRIKHFESNTKVFSSLDMVKKGPHETQGLSNSSLLWSNEIVLDFRHAGAAYYKDNFPLFSAKTCFYIRSASLEMEGL